MSIEDFPSPRGMNADPEKITIDSLLNIPYDLALTYIENFVRGTLSESGLESVVMGLSGGVDSSTLLAVLARAIPRENITVLIMPDTRVNDESDIRDALELASSYGVKHYYVPIDDIVDSYRAAPFYSYDDKLPTGNLRARVRMSLLYYYANKHRALVAGSSDRSELLIGYYTKYGDGGADMLPLGSLYKTQVRKLASMLGLPSRIARKPSSPALWPGHLAEEEIGIKYEVIDLVLFALFDLGLSPERASEATDTPLEIVNKIVGMHAKSRHKRALPPVPRLPWHAEEPIRELKR